jgi:hypothetical protein
MAMVEMAVVPMAMGRGSTMGTLLSQTIIRDKLLRMVEVEDIVHLQPDSGPAMEVRGGSRSPPPVQHNSNSQGQTGMLGGSDSMFLCIQKIEQSSGVTSQTSFNAVPPNFHPESIIVNRDYLHGTNPLSMVMRAKFLCMCTNSTSRGFPVPHGETTRPEQDH